ncbi:hypothetical protein EMN47_18975 [Prolixibacteraceae bacterium JC049]|nr:hypothetical protein [Prolixibacteraceae bacterium JC049]
MKYMILIVATMVLSLSTGCAQKQHNKPKQQLPPAEERAKLLTAHMAEQLKLDSLQQKQVYMINLQSAQQLNQVMLLTDRLSKFRAFRTLIETKDKKLKKELTKEQFKQYEKMKSEFIHLLKKRRKKPKNEKD